METLTEGAVSELLTKWFTVRLVTRDEDALLTKHGLRFTMPPDWDGKDVFARHAKVGIEPVANSNKHE